MILRWLKMDILYLFIFSLYFWNTFFFFIRAPFLYRVLSFFLFLLCPTHQYFFFTDNNYKYLNKLCVWSYWYNIQALLKDNVSFSNNIRYNHLPNKLLNTLINQFLIDCQQIEFLTQWMKEMKIPWKSRLKNRLK